MVICPRHGARFDIRTGKALDAARPTSPWTRSRYGRGRRVVDGRGAARARARRPRPRRARAAWRQRGRGGARSRACRRARARGGRADDRAVPLRARRAAATPATVLELGGSRGYSAIWLAAGARYPRRPRAVASSTTRRSARDWRQNVAEAGLDELGGARRGRRARRPRRRWTTPSTSSSSTPRRTTTRRSSRSRESGSSRAASSSPTTSSPTRTRSAAYSRGPPGRPDARSRVTVPLDRGLEVSVVLA